MITDHLHMPNIVFIDDGFGNLINAPLDQMERNFARLMQNDEDGEE